VSIGINLLNNRRVAAQAVSLPVLQKTDAIQEIKKADAEQQIVWGEVYAPGFPDSQGDFMTVETVRNMAYGFMKKSAMDMIDTDHSREKNGSYIVESFIAREDDPDFIPGSWVIGVHVPDGDTWALVKNGELNGFSIDGFGTRVATKLEIEMPEILTGRTTKFLDHDHIFYVKYDSDGVFLGGETSPGPDGHIHRILRGTQTEEAGDTEMHAHLFSFVEGVLNAQIAD